MSVSITAGELEATFLPRLAMVGASFTHRREELLGMGHGVEGYRDHASTFGIPLLHPWANRLDVPLSSALLHADPNGIPIHGVSPAALPFDLLEHGPDRISAEYSTERSPQALEVFPHPHRLVVEADIDETALTIRTTLHALAAPVPVAFGYHPYLSPPGADRSTWQITVPDMPQLELDARLLPTGASHPAHIAGGPLGDRSFDDAFGPVEDAITFGVAGGGRSITVTFLEGYRFAQIYTPPGGQLICFEPMTAPTNALKTGEGLRTLAPGESHRAAFRIAIQ
jgi:aldose 1-epimerase